MGGNRDGTHAMKLKSQQKIEEIGAADGK